jgi:microcystin degradation protein MlrC
MTGVPRLMSESFFEIILALNRDPETSRGYVAVKLGKESKTVSCNNILIFVSSACTQLQRPNSLCHLVLRLRLPANIILV